MIERVMDWLAYGLVIGLCLFFVLSVVVGR